MKFKLRTPLVLLLTIVLSFSLYSQTIPEDSLYLGHTPPGDIPQIFLPNSHARMCISNDNKTIYYSANEGTNYENTRYYKYFNDKWNGPFKLYDGYFAPTFSKDGDTLITMKYGTTADPVYRSYFSLKQDSIWSNPTLISQSELYYLQETNLGNYYCGSNKAGGFGRWDIYKVSINNTDVTYKNMGQPLNTINNDVEFFIAKDESYMVLGANEGGPSGRDLYISYKKSDSTWSTPKSLGAKINDGNFYKWGPYVTADNKYLFYAKATTPYNIYWVRFDRLLDSLRYTNCPPYAKWPISSQTATVGQLFNFTIPDSIFYDDDNDTLTYSATLNTGYSLPGWLSMNPLTGTLSGTPLASRELPLYVKITAKDSAQASGSCQFALYVMDPPSSVEGSNLLPNELRIEQNYPNPFNPTTTIRYSLARSSFVKLTIYNTLGQKIRTLKDSYQSAGEHSVVWDAHDERNNPVSSGIYFYKITANNQTVHKKMLLVK